MGTGSETAKGLCAQGTQKANPDSRSLQHSKDLGLLDSSVGEEPPVMRETTVQFLGWKDLLEKG